MNEPAHDPAPPALETGALYRLSRSLFFRPPRLVFAGVTVAVAVTTAACGSDPEKGTGGSGGSTSASGAGGQAAGSGGGDATGAGGSDATSTGAAGGSATGAGGGSGGSGGNGDGGSGPSFLCGNGATESGEACDDGNTSDGDYCSADCQTVTGSCGDGALQSNETCDDGSAQTGCDTLTDGGNGKCVPAGTCSPGYVLVGASCQPEILTAHVHIMVDNTCKMTVDPVAFTVAPGQKLKVSYHNHSAGYPVDVWMHYNGGYTDLQPGMIWNEQYEHCFGPIPSEGFADISTACSSFHLPVHCK